MNLEVDNRQLTKLGTGRMTQACRQAAPTLITRGNNLYCPSFLDHRPPLVDDNSPFIVIVVPCPFLSFLVLLLSGMVSPHAMCRGSKAVHLISSLPRSITSRQATCHTQRRPSSSKAPCPPGRSSGAVATASPLSRSQSDGEKRAPGRAARARRLREPATTSTKMKHDAWRNVPFVQPTAHVRPIGEFVPCHLLY